MSGHYHVTLADLIEIADAACVLDVHRAFYVDRADEQADLARRVARLHDIVERAAGEEACHIYGEAECGQEFNA